ncbi:phosphate ABC transporter substrate-binding protein [Alteromonas sp. ASW11-36]|uniref:Phosphate-binding protein n=1 Tax=Alteromonas arenosi TaxID=3055817 RepID=A0ABT7T1R5_9ALTE|nr:phosphate ABC transporter substrate-binding protein [Alteromonas sp. ASW11-36]MDM7861752.1 phosphate ABC transporter substrate-binding protein [Alteromonas sp. ASW11-36]
MRLLVSGVLILWATAVFAEPEQALPTYDRYPGVDGSITSVGSDTLANLLALWSQQFKTYYPHVKIQIQASGSSTAPPALTEGTATIGPMSRGLKSSEVAAFQRRHGYEPTMLLVAVDAIAIFVDRKNPINALTLQQVDAIFSATQFCGARHPIDNWSQLDVNYLGGEYGIRMYGRNSVSGTYGLFKEMALCEGDFRSTVNEQPGSSSVVMSIASTNGAIGYAAYGHKIAGVKALAIGTTLDTAVALTGESVRSRQYPFTRFLYIMINKAPGESLPTLQREFLRFILSAEGQQLVSRDGYFPVSADVIERQLKVIQ